MKTLRSAGLAVLPLLFAVSFLAAAPAPAPSAFDQLKSLIGTWEGVTPDGKSVRVTYEAASGGTALLERLKPADEPEMVTVYSPDGDRLAVTHYCSAGNQPHMRTEALAGNEKTFKFSFVSATNLASPDAGHMRGLVLTIVDHDHFTQEWTYLEKGKAATEVFRYTRKN
ncbi:MAG: hypothetical protein LAN71_03865 [Acidobacteriia bacterium]|nr:hypothetical protein [Terriglobia bacterium]